MIHRFRFTLLAAVLLLAAAVRVNELGETGFWFDELASLSVAHGWGARLMQTPKGWGVLPPEPPFLHRSARLPMRNVFSSLAVGEVNPPLYFLLLRGWETLFGDGARAVRAMSVCLSVVAVALLYAVARQHTSTSRALVACLLMALAGPQVEFAQEARPYVLLLVETLAAVWLTDSILQHGPRTTRVASLAAVCLAAMLTQYLAAAVLAGVGAIAVCSPRRNALAGRRSTFAVLLALAMATVLFALCWGSTLRRQLPTLAIAHRWLLDDHPGGRLRFALHLLQLPARFIFEPDASAASSVLLLMGGSLWLALPAAMRRTETRSWAVWLTFTVGAVAADDWLSQTAQLPLIRFTLAASPALYLLISSLPRGRFRWVLPVAAVLLAGTNLSLAYAPPWKNSLQPAGRRIAARVGSADALVFVHSAGADLRQAVQDERQYAYLLNAPAKLVVLLDQPCDAATLRALQDCRRVWVVWPMQNRSVSQVLPGFRMLSAEPLPPLLEMYGGEIEPTSPEPTTTPTAASATPPPVGPR